MRRKLPKGLGNYAKLNINEHPKEFQNTKSSSQLSFLKSTG